MMHAYEITRHNYEAMIHKSRYARWLPEHGRREEWEETVDRYITFMKGAVKSYGIPWAAIRRAIVNRDVLPSMRAMMTAGEALSRDNTCGYNCAYMPVDSPRAFDEAMFILLCGAGVGFSVENQYVSQLPPVPAHLRGTDVPTIGVADSKEGWALALRTLLMHLWAGMMPQWNLGLIRPSGAPLVTFGGRASGPEPLHRLFRFIVDTFWKARGRRLTPIEAHDIMCKIAEVVVVGGVRRSAMISLSDLDDPAMATAKSGEWWQVNAHRALANNSAVYGRTTDTALLDRELDFLIASGSGERGIFNRWACAASTITNAPRRDPLWNWGTNPCSEIILRPFEFCNLSEIVVRPDDEIEDIRAKAHIAAIIGTMQSTLTDFPYLRPAWHTNAIEERLLGVSITGIWDNGLTAYPEAEGYPLQALKNDVVRTNAEIADLIGISPSVATTCVKPSGTVSQLAGCSSGIHPPYAPFYVRRVRMDAKDPIASFLVEHGIPHEVDAMLGESTLVFEWPMAAPDGVKSSRNLGAIDHLRLWERYATDWCEHKPSITVQVRPEEWGEVRDYVHRNITRMSGVSFLPFDSGNYKQAPYEEIGVAEYARRLDAVPSKLIDWSALTEIRDTTTASQELACVGGACSI